MVMISFFFIPSQKSAVMINKCDEIQLKLIIYAAISIVET